MSFIGFKNKSRFSCLNRWRDVLNADSSEIKEEEVKIIHEMYRKKLSFTNISKKLERRSLIWVQNQYHKLLRKEL